MESDEVKYNNRRYLVCKDSKEEAILKKVGMN